MNEHYVSLPSYGKRMNIMLVYPSIVDECTLC